MNYEQARSLIEDGDVIAVHGVSGLLTPFTRFFTRSEVTHVGLALWMNGGLWLAELNGGGNHLIPLSQLAHLSFDVYAPPCECFRIDIRTSALNLLHDHIDYGLLALPVIGLLSWLGIRMFVHWRHVLVCVGYVVEVMEQAGWGEHSYMVSPEELIEELQLKFRVV